MDKPTCVGFAIPELSKLHMYRTCYDKLQPYFTPQKLLQGFCLDTGSFVLSMKTENIIKDLKNSGNLFVFSNLDENDDLFSFKNKKVINKIKIETPKVFWTDKVICLRSKAYSFKCKSDDESENKLKGDSKSQSKQISFDYYKKCLDGED